MTKKFFITGTDTEVGKTFVTALLCKFFVKQGKKVGAFKPIESGIETSSIPDYKILANAAKDLEKPFYTFNKPLAPLIAADLDNKNINIEKIIKFIQEDLDENSYDYYFVEGAGGLFVPITENSMIIDLITLLSFKVILVARTNLGTVNHTLLSIEALKNRNINIEGVILNEIVKTEQEQIDNNIKMIENFSNIKVIGITKYNEKEIISRISEDKWI